MSADDDSKVLKYRAELSSSPASRATAAQGMNLPPLRLSSTQQLDHSPTMHSISLRPSTLPSASYLGWGEQRPLSLLSRPRSQTERIELPSIRQAVPEIQMRGTRTDANYRIDSAQHSPTPVYGLPIPTSNPSTVSSHKRRRLSNDDGGRELRESLQTRLRSPPRFGQQLYSATVSPSPSTRRNSIPSTSDSRSGSTRQSPHLQSRGLPTIRSPPLDNLSIQRQDWRPTLPGLPSLTLDRGAPPVFRGGTFGEAQLDPVRAGVHTYSPAPGVYDTPAAYATESHANGYHPRGQSYSGPSGRERTPFLASAHHYSSSSNFSYGIETTDSGNESKQRKRRGNLPKETTDKLRAWFHAHIQHPYPTEDEKQDLMRQTGLQMNQISNWFINARRRQLPAMINNARAESDARSARGGGPSARLEGIAEFRHHSDTRSSGPLGDSDDGGSSFEDEYSEVQRQRQQGGQIKKRGSF